MRFLKRDLPFLCVLAVVAAMLVFSSTSVTRSALRYESDVYVGEVEANDIGVALLENDVMISRRTNIVTADDNGFDEGTGKLLQGNLIVKSSGNAVSDFHVGIRYKEELKAQNTGNIPQYVRMIIHKYWENENGKRIDLDPGLIDLHIRENTNWIEYKGIDNSPETIVLYYRGALGSGDITDAATDTLSVKEFAAAKVTESTETKNGGTVITTTYDYDGLKCVIEAEVDAVQTHNSRDAQISAWGFDATGMTGVSD